MRKAFAHTGAYDTAIAQHAGRHCPGRRRRSSATPYQALRQPADAVVREDPRPALRRESAPAGGLVRRSPGASQAAGLGAASILQGKELSYTNLLDLDAAARIVLEFDEPAAAVDQAHEPVRRRRPATSAADAYVRAREADSLAAFGGIVALNRPIDRGRGRSDRVDLHRGGDRAGASSSTRARCSQRKPNMRVVVADLDPELIDGVGSPLAFSARCSCSTADRVIEARHPWSAGALPRASRS